MGLAETLLYAASTVFQLVAVIFIVLQMRERRGQRSLQFLFAALMVMLAYRLYALSGVRGPATPNSVFAGVVGLAVSILLFCSLFSIRAAARSAVISEQLYRTIGESTDYGVWVCDAEGRNTYCSPSFLRLVGLTQAQCSQLGWVNVLHPDDLDDTVAAWKECVRTGENWYREHRFKGVDGKWHPTLACGMPVRDVHGKIVQWAGINLDIRRLKEAEERERDARTVAERQSRMKDEFLATVSHELRTPLNAILGWTQLLQQGGVKPADMQHAFDVVYRNSRAQVRLIEDLLDMSRIISGKVRLDVQSLMPNTVIESAIESVIASADARNIRIRKVLDTTAGPVTGDPNRLQQAIWNVLVNAIKFTPKGGRIEVLLERVNSHVEIIVTDNGEGISADFLPYIFDRFRQADNSISRQHSGLGIGLALVKNLVELHGGMVTAKSDGIGKGATFVIALPLRATESVTTGRAHPTTQLEAVPVPIARKQLQGIRVLIVDDDADARELVGRLLSECDATVTLAASAAEAKSILQSSPFDLIVCDIGMPVEDGLEFMQKLRRSGVKTPAVALTAFARSEDRMRALHAGFQIHLAKPVEPAEVIAVAESLSGRLRQQAAQ